MSEEGDVQLGEAMDRAVQGDPEGSAAEQAPAQTPAPNGNGAEINLNALLDVPVTLSVEIGRSRVPIKHLLSFNQGSVIELDKEVNEPLDLLVNGTLMARGEVVVVDGKFGLRLIDIVSPAERLKKLK
ncbi:MAG: flagellar motor switch protein FliN [Halioglobus sp.]|nr:flagellar motor switch protein FliN [Halioglobus sp.]